MTEEIHIIVVGRVQGICFRAIAKKHADALGLRGYAKNLVNGNVELCIQGTKKDAEELLRLVTNDFPPGTISSTTFSSHKMGIPGTFIGGGMKLIFVHRMTVARLTSSSVATSCCRSQVVLLIASSPVRYVNNVSNVNSDVKRDFEIILEGMCRFVTC